MAEDIQHVNYSFTCPNCNCRSDQNFLFIDNLAGNKQPSLVSIFACKKCEKRIKLEYLTKKTKKGTVKLVVLTCKVGEQSFPHKRFRPKR